jgi:hypothetical protein
LAELLGSSTIILLYSQHTTVSHGKKEKKEIRKGKAKAKENREEERGHGEKKVTS